MPLRVYVRLAHRDPDDLECTGPVPVEVGDGYVEPAEQCPDCGVTLDEADTEGLKVLAEEKCHDLMVEARRGW